MAEGVAAYLMLVLSEREQVLAGEMGGGFRGWGGPGGWVSVSSVSIYVTH